MRDVENGVARVGFQNDHSMTVRKHRQRSANVVVPRIGQRLFNRMVVELRRGALGLDDKERALADPNEEVRDLQTNRLAAGVCNLELELFLGWRFLRNPVAQQLEQRRNEVPLHLGLILEAHRGDPLQLLSIVSSHWAKPARRIPELGRHHHGARSNGLKQMLSLCLLRTVNRAYDLHPGSGVFRTIRLVSLLLFVPLAGFSQSGSWGMRGFSERFLVSGNYVIAVDGAGFSVYDTGAAGTVRKLARIETGSESIDGSIAGNDLFVLTRTAVERFTIRDDGSVMQTMHAPVIGVTAIAWNGRLLAGATSSGTTIWKPSADGSLVSVGDYPASAAILSMAWKGDVLFLALAGIGIKVVDGNAVEEIGYIPEASRGLAVSGDILYSASGNDGVSVIDVRNPSQAVVTGRTLAGSLYFRGIGADGSRVFAVEPPDKIHIIDASSVTAPQEVATLTEPVQAMAVRGDRLFVSGPTRNDFGDITDIGNPLRVFDVANPAPRLSAEVIGDALYPLMGVATDGSLAYVSDPPYFRVLDVSDSQAPREISSIRVDGLQPHVRILGTQAITYGTGDEQLFDLANPWRPRLVSTFHTEGHSPCVAAFVSNGIFDVNPSSGHHLVDFVHYPQPAIVFSYKNHPQDVVANGGDYAYVSFGSLLGIFNFPAPGMGAFARAVQIDIMEMAYASATNERPDALITQADNELAIYSLADPLTPDKVGAIPFDGSGPMVTSGNSVWIGTPETMTRMDITSLSSPILETTSLHVLAPQQVSAANGKVVVADRYSIRVFGPRTPAPPPPTDRHRGVSH
jgi:hypothetical protein